MKAILIVDLDDSLIPLGEDTITLEKGTIKYRDMNGNPFKITVEGLKLKLMPRKRIFPYYDELHEEYDNGWNDCINEILGEIE